MKTEAESYGARLHAEFARLKRLDHITRRLDYAAIQRLKQADRQQTVELFRGSHYEFLRLLKTKQPAEVVSDLLQQEQAAGAAAAAGILASTTIF